MPRFVISTIFLTIIIYGSSRSEFIDTTEYWPEITDDLTQVIWSHGSNSKAQLDEALKGDVMMIEADVNLGKVYGSDVTQPIMAHPPNTRSDLSLEDFLKTVVEYLEQNESERKGIKLDFKRTDILLDSYETIQELEFRINFPVWLNADIISGPGHTGLSDPVDAETFLSLSKDFFPTVTLSPGWKTGNILTGANSYSKAHVEEMTATLEKEGIVQPVTFPARAMYVGQSLTTLSQLLQDNADSTLTIWSSELDRIADVEAFYEVVDTIGKDKIFMDLPKNFPPRPAKKLEHKNNNIFN